MSMRLLHNLLNSPIKCLKKRIYVRGYNRIIQKRIAEANVELKPLTQSEISEIETYWGKYNIKPNLDVFKWYYNVSEHKTPRYISDEIYERCILPHTNKMAYARGLNDKNMSDILLGRVLPETIFHFSNGIFLDKEYKVISKEEAIKLAQIDEKVVIKPTIDTWQGIDVKCIESCDIESEMELFKSDFIVQKLVKQHKDFAELNESSVNVVRMTSFLDDTGVHILDAIVRVGSEGEFTDHFNIAIGVDEKGRLKKFGVDYYANKFSSLPNGFVFYGMKVPGYEEMISLAKKLHPYLSQARIIGWDFTTNEEGDAVVIEANLKIPDIFRSQECNGPIFGEMTEKILGELVIN